MSSEQQRSRAELVDDAQKMLARHGRRVPEDAKDRAVYDEDAFLATHCSSISHATEHAMREMREAGFVRDEETAVVIATTLFSRRYVSEHIIGDRQDSEPVTVAQIRAVIEQLPLQRRGLLTPADHAWAIQMANEDETFIVRDSAENIGGAWRVVHMKAFLAPKFAWRGSARRHARDIATGRSEPIFERDMDSDRAEDR